MEGVVPESVVPAMEPNTDTKVRETRTMNGERGIHTVPFKLITQLSSIPYFSVGTDYPFLEERPVFGPFPFPCFALYKRAGIDEHKSANL